MNRAALLSLMIFLLVAPPALADDAEERAEHLFTQFMPPCCWTGLLSEHHSGAADKMKEEIREYVRQGKTDREIQDIYVARYGERILSHPREEGFNRLAVITPVALFIAGFLVVGVILRKLRRPTDEAASEEPAAPSLDETMDDAIEREIREGR